MSPLQNLAQSSTYSDSDSLAGLMFGVLAVAAVAVLLYIVYAYLLGRIFTKLGAKAWEAWVPIYSSWRLLQLGDQKGAWILLTFIPFASIVATIFTIIAMHHIGLKLQKEPWFVILAIFVPFVWLGWLAFDDSKPVAATQAVPTMSGVPAYQPATPAPVPVPQDNNQPQPPLVQ